MPRALWIVLFAALAGASPGQAATLTIACTSLGAEQELCRDGAQRWAEATGNDVKLVRPPQSASEVLALFQQLLNAGSPDIDVFQIDVIWPGILGSHLLDLAPYLEPGTLDQHLPEAVDNVRRGDAVIALPWFADAPLLFYRSDLLEAYDLEVPQTWTALTEAAERLQEGERAGGNRRFWGFVWQGRAYEGLTCNALEWVASYGGGTFIDDDGRVTIDNPEAVAALDEAVSWVGTVSPPGVLNYQEEDSRAVFQSGNAAFMRNWPYALALANAADSPIRGRVAVTLLPAGPDGQRAATLGGQNLAVSRYSTHPELAVDLITYLTGPEEQRRRAVEGGFAPTIVALYDDPAVLAAAPFMPIFAEALQTAVARPAAVAGTRYNEASAVIFNAVHAALAGQGTPSDRLSAAYRSLVRLGRGGRW